MGQKLVYSFGNGKAEGGKEFGGEAGERVGNRGSPLSEAKRGQMKRILGGKGAGLHEMTGLGIPVPPGFTISAEVCAYAAANSGAYPGGLEGQVDEALQALERLMGKRLGDPKDPLLVSVRSGAAASMPGMMDTVLNLGLSDASVEGLARVTQNARFARDAYRRFITMFASIVAGVSRDQFEHEIAALKKVRHAQSDAELTAEDLTSLIDTYKRIYKTETGEAFPQDPRAQLWRAIGAVVRSWQNERAKTYRRLYHLEGLLGTAVNVQAMVFGNRGDRSSTGVCFTRDPASGENRFWGEFLVNAQGEDVVAGIRTPSPVAEMERILPQAYGQLLDVKDRLERHFKDVQDIEFTVEEGRLFLLQTRTGKRTGIAAVRIATDLVAEGLIDERTALMRVEPGHLEQLLFPIFNAQAKAEALKQGRLLAKGLNAGPGAAAGKIVFFAKDAEEEAKKGEKVILVRHETSPEDIGGMAAAQGILTATGGMTSHAAVVGRGMGKTCVVGCGAIHVDYARREMIVNGRRFQEGAAISIDGSTGEVIEGAVPASPSELIQVLVKRTLAPEQSPVYQAAAKVLEWADRHRTLNVRTNGDTPEDARVAVAFGAEGVGLCRTEHMFFGPDRIPAVRTMILARTLEERMKALAKLEPMQREDFVGIFRAMGSRPVTIRLLDPPLHEFLPKQGEQFEQLARELKIPVAELQAKAEEMHEFNPMLGHRGCRLAITWPEIYDMQVRAILDAACQVVREGIDVHPEIMFPIVGLAKELEFLRERAVKVAEETFAKCGARVKYLLGTMIEVPRAAITADEIARHADFFSFGTNDLTQCTYAFSRDDIGTFLPDYEEKRILPRDPFATLDTAGVGKLMQWAVERGRATRKELKLGICGEHGGDPSSIAFCHKIGLNYVSCSPYRVPIARLAAAQAAIEADGGKTQFGT
jgi:pyruvate, orthophosphate dikinase